MIKEYFCLNPDKRKDLREDIALQINTPKEVLEVLAWSINTTVPDAYDSAIDLLAKCSTITLEVASYYPMEDRYWATLINGIARAHHISIQDRLKVITQRVTSQKRVVSEAVIDALLLLADEVKDNQKDLDVVVVPILQYYINYYIEWFASDEQLDKHIQRYAEDVYSELFI